MSDAAGGGGGEDLFAGTEDEWGPVTTPNTTSATPGADLASLLDEGQQLIGGAGGSATSTVPETIASGAATTEDLFAPGSPLDQATYSTQPATVAASPGAALIDFG